MSYLEDKFEGISSPHLTADKSISVRKDVTQVKKCKILTPDMIRIPKKADTVVVDRTRFLSPCNGDENSTK